MHRNSKPLGEHVPSYSDATEYGGEERPVRGHAESSIAWYIKLCLFEREVGLSDIRSKAKYWDITYAILTNRSHNYLANRPIVKKYQNVRSLDIEQYYHISHIYYRRIYMYVYIYIYTCIY